MRIVFENLHENSFILRSADAIKSGGKPWPAKHWNILDYYLANKDKIYIFINEYGSCFANRAFSMLNNQWTRRIECWLICKINHIPWKRVVILREQDIAEDDILITYLFSLKDSSNHGLDRIHCYKVLDMNHFYARIPQLRFLPLFDCLVSEGNILNSKLLNDLKCYDRQDIVIKPYAFRERFKRKKSLEKRKNKAVATGTCEILRENRYINLKKTYHVNCLHPMRLNIRRHREEWSKWIDSKITIWPDDELEKKTSSQRKFGEFFHTIKNWYCSKHLRQRKYYSFDMADLYNNYRMAIVGEEIVGTPAVGFVEAMACGCAFIGVENGTYEAFGMKSGIHYIGYNGSSEDMLRKIDYYQKHEKELKAIAENGYQFAIKNFNGETVARNYFKKIYSLAKDYMSKREDS